MNERIKLLDVQADWDDEFREDFDIKKFAELIIDECAMIAEECDITEYGDFRSGIAQEIKRYFGV